MTARALAELVKEMRSYQSRWFKGDKSSEVLRESKRLERLVDAEVSRFLEGQGELFGAEPGGLTAEQPPPAEVPGAVPSWDLVITDLDARLRRLEGPAPILSALLLDARERDLAGRKRHSVPLQAGNGRDSLVDAYQEALDAMVYLRTAIEEAPPPANDLRLRARYEAATGLALGIRALIAEREGGGS
jgi:hypothetical protein